MEFMDIHLKKWNFKNKNKIWKDLQDFQIIDSSGL